MEEALSVLKEEDYLQFETLVFRNPSLRTIKDEEGETLLNKAIFDDFPLDTIQIIVNEDFDVNQKGYNDYTALHVAAFRGDIPILKYILSEGADINARDKQNRTALFLARADGLKPLVDAGVDINAVDEDGRTPLNFFADNGRAEMVEEILKFKPDLNKPDNYGSTPYISALSNEDEEIMKLLEEAGAETVDEIPEEEESEPQANVLPLPELTEVQVNATETVPATTNIYDVYMASDTPLKEFLEENGENGVVIHFGKQVIGTLRDALVNAYKDKTAIHYECKDVKGLMVSVDDVIDAPYYSLVTTFQSLIPISEFVAVLGSKHTHWKLTRTKDIVYTASRKAIGNGGRNIDGEDLNIVGRDHCQAGTNKTVYSITPVNLATGGRRKRRKTLRKRKSSIRVSRK